jgi:glycosyltransferase involved in cell wall biosynthesis
LKILLLLEATLGGTGRHILDLASGLLALDHEVHLVYSTLRADRAFVQGLAALRHEPRFRSHEIFIRRELGLSDIRAYFALLKYVRRHQPFDILHAHSTKAGFLLRLLISRRRASVVYTPHGLMTLNSDLKHFSRWAVCLLESALARVSDSIISVSGAERQCAIETGIPERKLIVIHNGLSPTHVPAMGHRDAMRAQLGLATDTVCIASVGLLVPNKEPGRLLDAFANLASKTSRPLSLLVIGWGPLQDKLRDQAAALGIGNSVRFLGQVSGIEYLPAVDILAHTSRYEGFGYVFLEALSAGIPIITTRVGGADELLEPGITGYICDPWDVEVFSTHLRRLVEDPEQRAAGASRARAKAEEASANAMVGATAALYHGLRKRAESSFAAIEDGVISRNPQ